ncbi:MAG TPA: tetratricopeptide repeat protein [Flavobacterium sp.]
MKCKPYFAFIATLAGLAAADAQSDRASQVFASARSDTAKVNGYNRVALQYTQSYPDSTLFYARKAADISRKTGYDFGLANADINFGNSALLLGNYGVALKHFSSAKSRFEKLADDSPQDVSFQNGLARALASSGVAYSEESNYYLALEHYRKALKIYQANNQQENIAKAYNNIGIVYKSQQEYPKALEHLKKALAIQEKTSLDATAVTLTNIGVIYFETGNQREAKRHYDRANELLAGGENTRGIALLYNYLGDYYNKESSSKAAEFYQKSIDLYESMQNKFGASLALYNLSKWHENQKSYTLALPLAEKSLAYAKSIGVLDQRYHSEKLLSNLYDQLHEPAKSLKHYKNYVAARDSITNQEHNKKFALAEMNFEYQKKEALLEERNKRHTQLMVFLVLGTFLTLLLAWVFYNRMQVKRRLTLQKEVAEYEQKALHLQMNPHFVFNCLGSISSFIVQNGTDSALKYLSKFSKLMRLTLEYSKGKLIPIDKEIESLQNYLELEQLRFHHKFAFRIRSSEKVEFNMGIPPLLIQPFVENAILHGIVPKDGDGAIEVSFDVVAGQLICTIEDDGIGISESVQLKENSVTAHQSMALQITKKRLEIMESITSRSAEIDISESETGSGTKVTLRLPIQYIQ